MLVLFLLLVQYERWGWGGRGGAAAGSEAEAPISFPAPWPCTHPLHRTCRQRLSHVVAFSNLASCAVGTNGQSKTQLICFVLQGSAVFPGGTDPCFHPH